MDFPLPPVGEGLFEVELVRWLVQPGDSVGRGQSLCEVMSDKATMEVPSPFAGKVTAILAEAGAKVKVGEPILQYDGVGGGIENRPAAAAAAPPAEVAATPTAEPITVPKTNGTSTFAAAPSVRHLARKLGVDLARVRGSGPAGRVLLDDLAPYVTPPAKPASKVPEGPDPTLYGVAGTRTKLVGLRRKIAEHMLASKRAIPHYAYIDECDVTDLVRLRVQLKDTYAKAGVKLTYLPFILKAVSRALKEFPIVNCTFDEAAQEMVFHDHYNLGVAVAGPQGLVVPVLKDADKKDVAALATEIDRLGGDVRSGRPKLEDLKGGTFTVTSVGSIGGLISTPIINHPEVGILGVGKVVRRPVYDSHGAIKPADLLYLSFSFDHRIVDGAIGAAFGNAVIKRLQNPAALLLPERFAG